MVRRNKWLMNGYLRFTPTGIKQLTPVGNTGRKETYKDRKILKEIEKYDPNPITEDVLKNLREMK